MTRAAKKKSSARPKRKSPKTAALPATPDVLFFGIRDLLHRARQAAVRQIDTLQVLTNFEIGRMLVEHEQKGALRAEYGKAVLADVARRLTAEFGRGFSTTNLKLMRQFYLQNQSRIGRTPSDQSRILASGAAARKKSQTVSDQSTLSLPAVSAANLPAWAKISWSHHVCLMGLSNPEERAFYEVESAAAGWSMRELERQVNSALYERLALSRNKAQVRRLANKGHAVESAREAIKDPYVLEFLGLEEKAAYSETDLESAIIDKLEHFLLELGKGFLFEARQKRFTFDEEHFRVDLVFYNRLLRCYVLVDLKLDKLTHQDLGQMQMYVNYFDRHVKSADENPTIGILLCKRKKDSLIEVTLPKGSNIFASRYQLYLPSKEDLKRQIEEAAHDAEAHTSLQK